MVCIIMHMPHNYATTPPMVVKYGGNALPVPGESDPLLDEIAEMWRQGTPVVLVHGGGPEIDRWLAARSIPTRRIEGMRVTDQVTLEVTEAVLCGTLNKRIVRALGALGIDAAGISGEDGPTLIATRALGRDGADLGFVGEIERCRPELIHALLRGGFLPVIAPLAVAADGSTAYNVNADLAAAAVAVAVGARAFVGVTNVPRVRRDPDDPATGIDRIDTNEARAFVESDACRESMKPKLRAAILAADGGVAAVRICDAAPRALERALRGDATAVVTPGGSTLERLRT